MSGAIVSPCGQYRPLLWRGNVLKGNACGWCLLNPSTADASRDDPTSTKLMGFTRDFGFTGYWLANVYDGRATAPPDLFKMENPVGLDADLWLDFVAQLPLIVVAWGNHAKPERVKHVVGILQRYGNPPMCLGLNANGAPSHPLYLPYSARLKSWQL